MKNKLYTLAFLAVAFFFLYEIRDLYIFLADRNQPVLTTPFGNLLICLTPDLSNGFYYYRLYEVHHLLKIPFSTWFFALSPNMAAVIFFQLSYLFILLFAKIRKTENSFILFAVIISIQYILFFDFITQHRWVWQFYFFTLLSNVAFIFMFFSFLNRKFPLFFWLFFAVLITFIVKRFFPDSIHEEIAFFKIMGYSHLITFFTALGVFIYDMAFPKKEYVIKSPLVRNLFVGTSLSIIFIPGVSYLLPLYWNINVSVFDNVIFYTPAVFPMILLIFSLHNGFISFSRPVWIWYVRFVYFVFFIMLYGLIVGFGGLFGANTRSFLWVHILTVFIFIFFFDAFRLFSEISIKYYINYRKFVFDEHITDIFQYIQTPFLFEDGIERFIKMTEAGSGASKVMLALNPDIFGGWLREKHNIRFLGSEEPIWGYRKPGAFQRDNPYLNSAMKGIPGIFLRRHSATLMIFFRNFEAALFLSEKTNGTPYLSEDLKYIKDLMRQVEPIMENYKLLIDNIENRKFEKELEVVSLIQKSHAKKDIESSRIKVYKYNQPSKLVTGDYLEVFSTAKNKYLFLLGDVSGHGLASAYYMGLVRSIIDGLIQSKKYNLTYIFQTINSVLRSKQSASSFMTLCAIELQIKTGPGKNTALLSYVNAGQHNPVVYLQKSGRLVELSGTQRVLGVMETPYKPSEQVIRESFRLIMTSDGAFEIFNKTGDILGEERFLQWIRASVDLSAEEQKDYLMKNIREYNEDESGLDDISILITDVNLNKL